MRFNVTTTYVEDHSNMEGTLTITVVVGTVDPDVFARLMMLKQRVEELIRQEFAD